MHKAMADAGESGEYKGPCGQAAGVKRPERIIERYRVSSKRESAAFGGSPFLIEKRTKNNADTLFLVQFPAKGVVPAAGLEPARCCHQWILSPPRLPFRQAGVTITALIILSQDFPFGKCFL